MNSINLNFYSPTFYHWSANPFGELNESFNLVHHLIIILFEIA